MEPYFRERARKERVTAVEASSPQARRAHLELAVRYVKAAEALYIGRETAPNSEQQRDRPVSVGRSTLAPALKSAFPLPASGAFADLLDMLDEAAPG